MASEDGVELLHDPECLTDGELKATFRRQPRKRCAPILRRRIEGFGNWVCRPKIEGRVKGLDDTARDKRAGLNAEDHID